MGNEHSCMSVPFRQSISGGLQDGTVLVVSGSASHCGDSFAVNFQCEHCSPAENIAFHFNPRFSESCVVCNTKERNSWGREERKHEMPFHKGHHFEIRVLISHHCYKVSVNGNHFLEYNHRIPLHRVNTLEITGSVDLENVHFQGAGGFAPPFQPTPCPPGGMYNPYPTPPFQPPCQQCPVPYHSPLLGGCFPSKVITISGSVPHHAKRFHVDLKFHGGTAFHLNPRLDENAVVRNSYLCNQWGSEERGGPMPFSKGQNFMIMITCEHHCFSVTVNGQHLFNYNHRVPNVQQIDHLEVEGDVVLQYVQA
ncbi:galectin-9 isoform X2 [Ambystoma mexicanum]|uniref:galectin-9 isoform X2 n=1 Tax=Ambystoma mexicanum TaxID=8296 RepID=UPI0037E7BC9E